jgi:signal recognition particle receptor subunit beta
MHEVVGATHGPQICFVGPVGVGKTTAALNACTTPVLMTEVSRSNAQSEGGRHRKPTTTVGLEIGEWIASDGRRVCLVGTPGQERFDLARRSALPRSDAIVLWLFGAHPEALDDAIPWLEFVSQQIPTQHVLVAVTRLADDAALEPFQEVVHQHDSRIPVIAGDPRIGDSINRVLETAYALCGPRPTIREEMAQ